jgi:hypothetical protein
MNTRHLSMTLVAMLSTASGCMKSSSSPNLSVSARTSNGSADGGSNASSDAGPGCVQLGQSICVTGTRLMVKKIALEGTLASTSAPDAGAAMPMDMLVGTSRTRADHGGDGEGDDEADDFKTPPFCIRLTPADMANGAIAHVLDSDVPAGTFNEIKIVIGPVAAARADAGMLGSKDAGTDSCDAAGDSVIVDGTFAGGGDAGPASFEFTSRLREEQKHETDMTVTVDGTTKNLTLTIDMTNWFKDANGRDLDPRLEANREAIEDNIKASIDIFEDEDEDGMNDRQEHDGGGDGHH